MTARQGSGNAPTIHSRLPLLEEQRHLQAKISEIAMDQELLLNKIHRLEENALPWLEVEETSATVSPSSDRRYGISRVCRVWEMARSDVYAARKRLRTFGQEKRKPGPKTPNQDELLAVRDGDRSQSIVLGKQSRYNMALKEWHSCVLPT